LVKEDVVGLKVPVHDVVLIEDLKGIDELFEDEESLFFRDDSIFPENAFEGASVAVLVDKVEVVGSLEHVDILDDMLVFLNVGQNINLVDRAFLQLLILFEPPHLNDLNRVLLIVQFVDRPVDLAVSPLSDYLVQCVVLNNPHHRCFPINNYYTARKELEFYFRGTGKGRGEKGNIIFGIY